ncbi:E3 SUMO-protein ligase ZBED1-like [Brachyistius frenatus]|uniref:E3 SUMO-protein ligase ZBED1-like n=1 Tax=Brachyistius frenatus TaxID=100188 RepID=UPI0037E924EF
MVASVRELKLRHHVCIAHTLNLIVKKTLDQQPVLSGIRAKARKLVGFFRSSTTAKEKLTQVQLYLGMANMKLMQEVETRWNSTYLMLQRLVEQREPVGAALAGLQHDIPFLTSEEFNIVGGCLSLLSPFYDATVELSAEENVSASKVVPLVKMLDHTLQEEITKPAPAAALEMGDQLIRQLREKLYTLQSMSIVSLATLLDPRFKAIGFFSQTKATEAIKRLTSECATIIRSKQSREEIPQASTSHDVTGDTSVMEARKTQDVTADALWRSSATSATPCSSVPRRAAIRRLGKVQAGGPGAGHLFNLRLQADGPHGSCSPRGKPTVASVADWLTAGLSRQMAAVRWPRGTGQGLTSGELILPYTPNGANPGS